MKRRILIRRLKIAGYELEEGAKHTKVLKDGKLVAIIPRQVELDELLVKITLKDLGLS